MFSYSVSSSKCDSKFNTLNPTIPPKNIFYSSQSYVPGMPLDSLTPAELDKRVEEVSKKKFKYCEEYIFEKDVKLPLEDYIGEINVPMKEFMKEREYVGPNTQSVVISKMIIDNKEQFGVFAKKKISKGDVIGLYTGQIQPIPTTYNENPYFAAYPCDGRPVKEKPDWIINAEAFGNFTRFINDLPTTDDLKKYKFDKTVNINQIQTENVELRLRYYKKIPYMVLIAKRDINIGEQLGYTYTSEYWSFMVGKVNRAFFNTHGETISPNLYVPLFLKLNIKGKPFEISLYDIPGLAKEFQNEKTHFQTVEGFIISKRDFLEALSVLTKEQRLLYFSVDPCEEKLI